MTETLTIRCGCGKDAQFMCNRCLTYLCENHIGSFAGSMVFCEKCDKHLNEDGVL